MRYFIHVINDKNSNFSHRMEITAEEFNCAVATVQTGEAIRIAWFGFYRGKVVHYVLTKRAVIYFSTAGFGDRERADWKKFLRTKRGRRLSKKLADENDLTGLPKK
jgi:hypothetical protein